MHRFAVALSALAFVVSGCGDAPPSASPGQTSAARVGQTLSASAVFAQRCQTCHGPRGRGDGPAGRALTPRPRSFANTDWQARVTDAHLRAVILRGGAQNGLSALMPPSPDLMEHPTIVDGLVKMIRSFAGP